ncbi:MAG: ABC transporter permease [Candidatus Delongbacteria bacterium]|nr:ABC transporter permease [Candidatus Delongbacteria bacterium]
MRHIYEAILISLNSLKENKLRTFLTLLGIMIGVTTIIFIHSVLKGTEKYFVDNLSSLGLNTLYISKFSWYGNNNWPNERKRKALTIENADFIRQNSDMVEYVTPLMNVWVRSIKYKSNEVKFVNIKGSTEDYEYTSDSTPEQGRFFNSNEVERNSNVAVLGNEVSKALFAEEDPLGKIINVRGRKFMVIGVEAKKGEVFGSNIDKEIVIPIGCLSKYFSWNKWYGVDIMVKAKDPTKVNQTIEDIASLLRISRGLKPDEENDFSINEINQIIDFLKKVTALMRLLILAIGSLSLLVGGIGIMNIMLVSVTQRTREIGTRKAIGATSRIIMFQFTIESVILCLFGGVFGIVAGFAIAKIISSFTPLPSTVSISSILIGVGYSALVGLIFGFYPAKKAAKLNPIDALRYE